MAYGEALPEVENLKHYAPAELIPQVIAAVRKVTEAQGGEQSAVMTMWSDDRAL